MSGGLFRPVPTGAASVGTDAAGEIPDLSDRSDASDPRAEPLTGNAHGRALRAWLARLPAPPEPDPAEGRAARLAWTLRFIEEAAAALAAPDPDLDEERAAIAAQRAEEAAGMVPPDDAEHAGENAP